MKSKKGSTMKKKSLLQIIHSCCALSVKQIIKKVSFKTEGVKSKSYDTNSLLGGHCTLNTDLFQAKTLYSLSHVLKIVLKLTKRSASSTAQLQNASMFIEKAVWSNLTMFVHVMEILQEIVRHDKNFCIFFWSYTLCSGSNKSPFNPTPPRPPPPHTHTHKNIGDMAFTSNESLLMFLLQGG